MSRWIDANRLLTERMKSKYYHLPNGDTAIPIIDIERAPSIDIVCCQECKYWLDGSGLCKHWSKLYGSVLTNADDFCSYGERSEKPNNSKVSEKPTGSERSSE